MNGDCVSTVCTGTICSCGSYNFTFTVNSNSGGVFDSAAWPGGTATQTPVPGCSVTINRANDNIDLVCGLANPFSINSLTGNGSCSFAVALGLENADPRFPRCAAQPVAGVTGLEPAAGSSGRAVLDALLAAVPDEVPSGARCTPPHVVAVPTTVRRDGKRRPGALRFLVRADVGSRQVAAPLTLRCTPSASLN